jgi:hypothetical protein
MTNVDERVASGTVLSPNLDLRYATVTFVEISIKKFAHTHRAGIKGFVTDMTPARSAVEE